MFKFSFADPAGDGHPTAEDVHVPEPCAAADAALLDQIAAEEVLISEQVRSFPCRSQPPPVTTTSPPPPLAASLPRGAEPAGRGAGDC